MESHSITGQLVSSVFLPSINCESPTSPWTESTSCAEFLIELKLNEEQEKIAQIVRCEAHMYDEYVNASKGKVPSKGKKAKEEMVKVECPIGEFWKPGGCSHGPKYHPRRQPGRYAICGSTCRYTSQCKSPVKPKAKNAEWDDTTWQQEEVDWQEPTWESTRHLGVRKARARGLSPRVNLKARVHRDRLHPGHHSLSPLEVTDPNPKPNQKPALA